MQKFEASLLPKHCDVQPQYVYESTIHPQNLLNTLNEQRKFGLLCDITVIVEGVQLLAHKAVLAACSSYFNGIIMDPANVSHNIVLELSSITKVGMENLLDFAYTSKLTVSKDNIDHVLCAARELEVKNLEYSCLNLLKQKLLQDMAGAYAPSCFASKNVCQNSTISRQLVPSNPEPSSGSYESFSAGSNPPPLSQNDSIQDQQNMAKNNCPLMAQLSLDPRPQLSVQCSTSSDTDKKLETVEDLDQSAVKTLKNLCLLEKADRKGLISKTLPQMQQVSKKQISVPVVKTVTVCPSASEPQGEATCSIPQPPMSVDCSNSSSKGRYVFAPSFNSDTDEALSTDDDIERNYKCLLSLADSMCRTRKHPNIELPLSIEEITKLPRSELQELLNKHPNLSVQQISAMHEIRRRGKNRIAAQRCRKRKMDCIRSLQCELETLHREHSELMNERRSVCDTAGKLCKLFQQRCTQVFDDMLKPSEKASQGNEGMEVEGTEDGVISMAKYFQNESDQAQKMVDRLKKLPCNNLPPLNWACPMMNQEIVVVCDAEERYYKPCSPSMCSTASFSSDITEGSNVECPGSQDAASSNPSSLQRHTFHEDNCSGAMPNASKHVTGDVDVEKESNHGFNNSSTIS